MPCNYRDYQLNWKTKIRPYILVRACNRCEGCGMRNYSVIHRVSREVFAECDSYREATEERDDYVYPGEDDVIIIVLTIAHLDHTPMNCHPDNLKALCQRCHNRYDAKFRAAKRKLKYEKIQPNIPLFPFTSKL